MQFASNAIALPPTRAFYRRAAAFCAMLAMAMFFRAEHLTDWDSWDYVSQALRGQSSDLLLGRWWFIAVLRCLWLTLGQWLGIDKHNAYLLFQTASALMMALALVALMAWTFRLTRSPAAELLLAAMIIPGPMVGIYASAVMTESMTVLMLSCGFLAWEKSLGLPIADCRRVRHSLCEAGLLIEKHPPDNGNPQSAIRNPQSVGPLAGDRGSDSFSLAFALLAGLCFGIAVDIREPAALFCAWPILTCLTNWSARNWKLMAVALLGTAITLGVGVLGGWDWYPWWPPGYVANMHKWTEAMARERQLFGVGLDQNAIFLGEYAALASAAVTLLAIPASIWALFRNRRLFWLFVAALPYTGSLLVNHDLGLNPRFAIPLIWMLGPVAASALAAWFVDRRAAYLRQLAISLLGVLGLGIGMLIALWPTTQDYYFRFTHSQYRLVQAMRQLPPDATVIAGPGTPVAMYLNRIGDKEFDVIASGWGWPGEKLPAIVNERLREGTPVYANLDPDDWVHNPRKDCEWSLLEQISRKYDCEVVVWPMVRLRPRGIPATTQSTTTPAASR